VSKLKSFIELHQPPTPALSELSPDTKAQGKATAHFCGQKPEAGFPCSACHTAAESGLPKDASTPD